MKPKTKPKCPPVKKPAAKAAINYEEVRKFAGEFATLEEIAAYMQLDAEMIKADKNFITFYNRAYAEGKLELRECQVDLAKKGNAAIMNWLGKCILGQTENNDGLMPAYDYSKLPVFYLKRIIDDEDPLKVINEYEAAKEKIGKD
jgi:hypothetical protein